MQAKSTNQVSMDRPVRWDHPLDASMLSRELDWILNQPPFCEMNPDVFSQSTSIENILRHDSRILRFEPGDVIVREGDYGSSAFLVLRGSVRAFLEALWQTRGKPSGTQTTSPSWLEWVQQSLGLTGDATNNRTSSHIHSDNRRASRNGRQQAVAEKKRSAPVQQIEVSEGRNRIFLQDIQAVFNGFLSEPLGVGEIFGEMAAITRSQHRYTVVADSPTIILEIRWQGLRILRRDKKFRDHLDERFREKSLQTHLRETSLFRFLDADTLDRVIAATKLESYGEREWFAEYKDLQKLDVQSQINREPVIATEGHAVQDLLLIRAGFARLSFEQGQGHQTIAYLGRGQMFGLAELAQRFRNPTEKPLPFQASLRALGFVDVLRIPREIVLEQILPRVRSSELPKPILNPRYDSGGLVVPEQAFTSSPTTSEILETPLLEFLVDERLINGKQTMLIDLDRCTGCDECVKACAATHEGTPRFVRNGPQYGPLLFAHACMHCTDPVCMIGCPTGAIARDQDTGVISVDPNTCIGCKTCSESCPYDNIVMQQVRDNRGRGVVDRQTQLPILQATKCDMCHKHNAGPACHNACPHNALFRIDTSQPQTLEQWLQRRVA